MKTLKSLMIGALFTTLVGSVHAHPSDYFACGKETVQAHFYENTKLTLTMNGKNYELVSVPAASGAKYETPTGVKPHVMFWNKGKAGALEVDGKNYPECQFTHKK